jgi:hypothetical protein
VADETEHLAWVVLRTVNRMQAKGSTVRVIVPRDPEVVSELAQELTVGPNDDELLSAEEYLLERSYIVPVDIGLTRGSYSITPAGLDWIGRSFPAPPRAPETAGEEPGRAEPRSSTRGPQEATERPFTEELERRSWWRRVFGGELGRMDRRAGRSRGACLRHPRLAELSEVGTDIRGAVKASPRASRDASRPGYSRR